MKFILTVLIFSMFTIYNTSCSNYTHSIHPLKPTQLQFQHKKILLEDYDEYGLFESGENAFYRQGFFMYGLYVYGLLDIEIAEQYCQTVSYVCYEHKQGCMSRPQDKSIDEPLPGNRWMSRDDYFGMLLGLHFVRNIHGCADPWIDKFNAWIHSKDGLKLKKYDVWSPFHKSIFSRADYNEGTYILADGVNYLNAKHICNKPRNDTSDKLLLMAYTLIIRTTETTFFAEAWNDYCHQKWNFNEVLEIYYGGHSLRYILWDTL